MVLRLRREASTLLGARLRGDVVKVCPLKLLLLRLPSSGDGTGGGGALLRTAGGGGARRRGEVMDGADQDRRRVEVEAAHGDRLRGLELLQLRRLLLKPPERRRAESRRSGSQVSLCSL